MSLKTIIQQIKSATLPGENTALRVGSALEQMDSAKRNISDSLSTSETIDMLNAVKLLATTGTPFLGAIDPSTTVPAGNFWAFASEGTYANAGGIVVGTGEIAIITRVGATFDSISLDVPVKSINTVSKTGTVGLVDTYTITYTDGSTPTTFEVKNGSTPSPNLRLWSALPFSKDEQVVKDNVIYIALQNVLATDVPGVSAKWKSLGSDDEDVRIALKWFLEQQSGGTEVLDKTFEISNVASYGNLYGIANNAGKVLIKDNTIIPITEAGSYFNVWKNIPTKTNGIKKIIAKITPYGNGQPPTNANIVGIKADGSVIPLVLNPGAYSGVLTTYDLDITEYESISVGMAVLDSFPATLNQTIKFYKVEGGQSLENSVKNYIDSNSGGSNVDNTIIFAESEGVSSTNTGAENTTILNNIFSANQNKGVSVYLPAGELKIAGTLNIYDTTSLIGSGRGSVVNSQGGTILKATTANVMINVTAKSGSDTGSPIKHMKLDGSGIATKGIVVNSGMAFFTYEDMCVYNFTDVCIETIGALIYTMRNIRIWNAPNGLRLSRTPAFQANHIRFEMVQFAGLTNIATQISGGAQVVFEQCDWEQNGTVGNINTGNMLIEDMSPLNEGVDVTLNNCWSEYVSGGFWMKINSSAGVTTIRDTMLWRLSGDATNGIINNGSKLLITGSTRINDFPTNKNIVTNGGETRVGGFTNIGAHSETSGGTFKTNNASYI